MVVHSFTGVFEHIKEIRQFKIIQKEVSGILIEYIPDENFSLEILKKITHCLQQFILNQDFNIFYEEVVEIKPTKSGKPQIIESFLKK